ncbi:GrpB family protein [Listeria costaricensis]|uniref:GrpB family protein n=1 Tax=Listeria costaricensis TaxID=2026604 RepID=UPI000C06AF31|nr:GrpB family protein [Listeria costaricensis]
MKKIEVVPHRLVWQAQFKAEKAALEKLLSERIIALYHIGSSSVAGLSAKPIIDMLLVTDDLARLDLAAPLFEQLGYEVMGEFGIPGRRYYRKGTDPRTHHIHAFQFDNVTEIERHILFRDYLRTHPKTAAEYGQLKTQLAAQFPHDIDGYCDGKDAFVKRVEKEALIWHFETRDN